MPIRTKTRIAACLFASLAAMSIVGCSSFYKITDTRYGDTYYTESIDGSLTTENGMITFVDAETGSRIKLYDYRIELLKRQDFEWEVEEQRYLASVRDDMD